MDECEPWYGVTQFVPLEKKENSVWEAARQKPLISEIFTDTEPVVRAAQHRGHATGATMTLGSGYDFHKHADRQRCLETIRKEKPFMLVIAFPCGPWSPVKRLFSSGNAMRRLVLRRQRRRAKQLVDFAVELALEQERRGDHYVLENPDQSAAWDMVGPLRQLRERGALSVRFDQCRLGLRGASGSLHRKRTRFVTSSSKVQEAFNG